MISSGTVGLIFATSPVWLSLLLFVTSQLYAWYQKIMYGKSWIERVEEREEEERKKEKERQEQINTDKEMKEKAIKEDYNTTLSHWKQLSISDPRLTKIIETYFKLHTHPARSLMDIETPVPI